MKKIKMSDILLTVCAIAIVCGIGSLTLRGKKTTEKLIIGDWYQQWSDSLTFSIYDDGTVNVPGSYGLGKWSLVNDNQLILSDFYGETIILKIENIDADNMEVRHKNEDGTPAITPREAQEALNGFTDDELQDGLLWNSPEDVASIILEG